MEALAASAEAKRPSHVAAWRSSTSAWRRKRSSASVFSSHPPTRTTDGTGASSARRRRTGGAEEGGVGTERRAGGVGVSSGSRGRGRGGSVASGRARGGAVRRGVRDRGHRGELLRRQGALRSQPCVATRCAGGAARGNAGEEGRDQGGARGARLPSGGDGGAKRGERKGGGEIRAVRARERRRDRARTRRSSSVPRLRARRPRYAVASGACAAPNPRVGDARRAARARVHSHHVPIPRVRKSVHQILAPTRSRFRQSDDAKTSRLPRVACTPPPSPRPDRHACEDGDGFRRREVRLAPRRARRRPRRPRLASRPRTKHASRSTVSSFHLPRSRRNASRRRTRRRTSAARSKSWTRRGASILVARATARLAPRALYSRIPPTTHARTSRRDTQGRQDRPGRARVGVPGAQAQDQEGTRARALTPLFATLRSSLSPPTRPPPEPFPRSLLSSSRTSRT